MPVAILAYLLLGAELGMGGRWGFASFGPNLPLLGVVFICLNAAREPALTACLVLGLIQDLTTSQAPGLHAFAYGLVGIFTTSTSRSVLKNHPVTHFVYAFTGQIIVSATILVASVGHSPHPHAAALLGASVYTAVLAPVVMYPLDKIKRVFGFTSPDRRVRAF